VIRMHRRSSRLRPVHRKSSIEKVRDSAGEPSALPRQGRIPFVLDEEFCIRYPLGPLHGNSKRVTRVDLVAASDHERRNGDLTEKLDRVERAGPWDLPERLGDSGRMPVLSSSTKGQAGDQLPIHGVARELAGNALGECFGSSLIEGRCPGIPARFGVRFGLNGPVRSGSVRRPGQD